MDSKIVTAERVRQLISKRALQRLRRAFKVRGMPFFLFYLDLYERSLQENLPEEELPEEVEDEIEDESDLSLAYKSNARILLRLGLSPAVGSQVRDSINEMRPLFKRLKFSRLAWRRIALLYGALILDVAKDRGVYLSGKPMGPMRWLRFRIMSGRQEQIEILKDEQPEVYAAIQARRQSYRQIESQIKQAIEENGQVPERSRLMGRVVDIGVDPVTEERLVYDVDGSVLPEEEWKERRKDFLKETSKTTRKLTLTKKNLQELRSLSDDWTEILKGPVEYVSITDDKAKSGQLSRVYPIKRFLDGSAVVSDGRFKGVFLDDLVNSQGRLIEGTAYTYSRKRGGKGIPKRRDVGNLEPYVTLSEDDKNFFIKLPGGHGWAEVRRAMKSLSEIVPSINPILDREQAGVRGRQTGYYFRPEDFGVVKDTIQNMALSKGAMDKLQQYFKELASNELATAKEHLGSFSQEELGGFKPGLPPLYVKQKQALAWMESRGNSGVCALDTGVGKTKVAIAMMQKLVRDGFTEDPDLNGRFLFVSPTKLTGNVIGAIHKNLENPVDFVENQLDVMSYPTWARSSKSGEWKGEPWDPSQYIAIFFDEIQEAVKNINSQTARGMLSLNHPRKICLTASPVNRDPMEAYILAAITNNIDLSKKGDEGRELRADMRRFKNRFAEVVGGRVVGVKQDPATKRDLYTWAKKNIYFTDKQDVEEYLLPKLVAETEPLIMPSEVEDEYRRVTTQISKELRALVGKFRDRGFKRDPETGELTQEINPAAADPKLDRIMARDLQPLFKRLNALQNYPDEITDEDGKKLFPGITSIKVDRATEIVGEKIAQGGRTLLFTDDKHLLLKTVLEISSIQPGVHAAAFSDAIRLYFWGQEMQTFGDYKLPFRKKAYKAPGGREYAPEEWVQFAFKEVIIPEEIASLALLGSSYSTGQNLQAFDTVVHLDRNNWSSESMKQRTARSWRRGQQKSVEEITLDMVYADPVDSSDRTLDQIRQYFQVMSSELFERMIHDAQSVALGKEWFEMEFQHASFWNIDQEVANLVLSPYIANSQPPQSSRTAAA